MNQSQGLEASCSSHRAEAGTSMAAFERLGLGGCSGAETRHRGSTVPQESGRAGQKA